MQRTNNPQINTKVYWNYIYTTPAKEEEYWTPTWRFFTLMNYIKDGDKFIDLGCGVGLPCKMLKKKRKGCEIWGVDISDQVIEANKKDDKSIHWKQGYVGSLTFLPSGYFDVVFSGEVIEHLDNPPDLFVEAHRILKKGGKLIITTPREDCIYSSEHLWYFNKADVQAFYDMAKFKDVEFIDLPDLERLKVFFTIGIK